MIRSVAILLALVVGALAAHWLLEDQGYVMIDFRGYIVEMSVPGLLIALTAAYLAVRGLAALARAPHRVGGALAERRHRRAGGRLTRGLMHLTSGEWAKGERLLTRGARGSDAPLVNYLLAARAAHWQGAHERRDEWLRIAHERLPDAEQAVLLTQAELELDAGEHDRALAALKRVLDAAPDHPVGLALAARAHRARGDRDALAALLPRLGRARLAPGVLEETAVAALEGVLSDPELTRDALERRWAELPATVRRLPQVVALHARALDRLGHGAAAERELRAASKRDWATPLVAAYGRVRGEDPARQLRQAESWLRSRPEDAALLLTAARLCIANELWGKARSYLESSIAIDPAPESYALYGRLLDRLGENERAAVAFRSGLALVDGGAADADVPALAPPQRLSAATTPDDA